MAFNNQWAFNISKATATTSTTNTTTTSISGNVKPSFVSDSQNTLLDLTGNEMSLSHTLMAKVGEDTLETNDVSLVHDNAESPSSSIHSASKTSCEETRSLDPANENSQKKPSPAMEVFGSLEKSLAQFQMSNHKEQKDLKSLTSETTGQSSDDIEQQEPKESVDSPLIAVDLLETLGRNADSPLSAENTNEKSAPEQSSKEFVNGIDIMATERSMSLEDINHKEASNQEAISSMGAQPYEIFIEPKSLNVEILNENHSYLQDSTLSTRPGSKRQNSVSRVTPRVNPKEQHQQSHKPFDFQVFLAHLKKKSADPLVRYIQSFLLSFSRQSGALSVSQMIKAVTNFKQFMDSKFLEFEPFASMDAVDLENSGEGVEKLIMNRLYDYCFSPEAIKKFGQNASSAAFDDVQEDYEFRLQLEKFSWILPNHLDIDLAIITTQKITTKDGQIDHIDYAVSELNKINKYRAPRDKIICILNACKIIFNLLQNSKLETNADAFIPMLILVIIRAKTDNLISNIKYIERYRGDEWLNHGETSYYLSSIQATISFIQKIEVGDLTIKESEFDANMEAWDAELKQRGPPIAQPVPKSAAQQSISAQETLAPSNVILAGAEMFTKSITNFMSPSPLVQSDETSDPPQESQVTPAQIDETFNQLTEIFPNLDKSVLRDIIVMKKADFDASLDLCLQLCNDN